MGCASIETEVLLCTPTVDVETQAGDVEVVITPSASLDYLVESAAVIDTQVEVVPVVVDTSMERGSIDVAIVCSTGVKTQYYLIDENDVPILTYTGGYLYLTEE